MSRKPNVLTTVGPTVVSRVLSSSPVVFDIIPSFGSADSRFSDYRSSIDFSDSMLSQSHDYFADMMLLQSKPAATSKRMSYLQAVSVTPIRSNAHSTPCNPVQRLTVISGPANEAVQFDMPLRAGAASVPPRPSTALVSTPPPRPDSSSLFASLGRPSGALHQAPSVRRASLLGSSVITRKESMSLSLFKTFV